MNPKNLDYDDFRLESIIINDYVKENGHLVFKAIENSKLEKIIEALKVKFERVETFKDSSLNDEIYVICLNSNNEELKIVDDARNFKYLDDLIHSGVNEIVLDSDIVLGDGEKSKYFTGIELDVDDLVIDGRGHIIDARDKTRILECSARNVTIKNLIFINGDSWAGGAICNEGDLTISESIFADNFSSADGGALFNDLGNLLVSDCLFVNNKANSIGGAIYFEGGLKVEKSLFFDNADRMGKSIDSFPSSEYDDLDCKFENF